jgi:hypothetical protein
MKTDNFTDTGMAAAPGAGQPVARETQGTARLLPLGPLLGLEFDR